MTYLFLTLLLASVFFVYLEIKKIDKKRKEDAEIFEKWIFRSLYSINNKVLLPEEKEKPGVNKPTKVYSPTQDGLSEFNGLRTDFLQED